MYGLNLTDEYYFYGKLSLLGNSGREQGNPAPPREMGLSCGSTSSASVSETSEARSGHRTRLVGGQAVDIEAVRSELRRYLASNVAEVPADGVLVSLDARAALSRALGRTRSQKAPKCPGPIC